MVEGPKGASWLEGKRAERGAVEQSGLPLWLRSLRRPPRAVLKDTTRCGALSAQLVSGSVSHTAVDTCEMWS